MEERKRFRNHISVIAEKIGTGTYALLAVLVGIFLRDAEEFLEFGSAAASDRRALLGMGLVLAVLLMMIVKTAWTWSKTWISIQDQAIVIEKNTVNGSVHNIGIRSISNINLEQNLFERLVGTYKVKIDTASLSTANATDVTIVLKKEKAEAFKAQIAGLLWETEEAPAGPRCSRRAGDGAGAVGFCRDGPRHRPPRPLFHEHFFHRDRGAGLYRFPRHGVGESA